MARIGYTTLWNSSGNVAANTKLVSKITPSATISVFGAAWVPFSTATLAKTRYVIYTDNAGSPDTLVAASIEKIGGLNAGSWTDYTLSTPVTLTGGQSYWIGIHTDTTLGIYQDNAVTTNGRASASDTYSDGTASSFGTATFITNALTSYLKYTDAAMGATSAVLSQTVAETLTQASNPTVRFGQTVTETLTQASNPTVRLGQTVVEVLRARVAAEEPDLDKNVLLCHFDGTDGQTTTIDSSSFNKVITLAGNAQLSTAQAKFGSASLLLDGTGDYASLADSDDWSFGATTNSWTVELQARWTVNSASGSALIGQFGATGAECSWVLYLAGGNTLRFRIYNGLSNQDVDGAWTPSLDTWYHIAADRVGNTLRVYVNGVVVGSTTSSTHVPQSSATGTLKIGRYTDSSTGLDFNGYIDEVRVTKGIARYQGAFTAPTAAFNDSAVTQNSARTTQQTIEVVRSTQDAQDDYYGRAVQSDAPRLYYRLDESSGTAAANLGSLLGSGTYVNSPSLDQSGALPNTSNTSVFFDRVQGEYIDSGFDAGQIGINGSHDLTIECWVKRHSAYSGTFGTVWGLGNASSGQAFYLGYVGGLSGRPANRYEIGVYGGLLEFDIADDTSSFHHVVVRYDADTNTVSVWVDGAAATLVSGSSSTVLNLGSANDFQAGRLSVTNGDPFTGWLDEIAVYDTQLPDDRVVAHYNAASATDQSLSPSAVTNSSSFGNPTLADSGTGASTQTLNPTGFSATSSFGNPTINIGQVSLSPVKLDNINSFGTQVLTVGTPTLIPSTVVNTGSLGSPTITTGQVSVSPVKLTNSSSFGTQVIDIGAITLNPSKISDADSFGSPNITVGSVTLQPARLTASDSLGSPSLQALAPTLAPQHWAEAASFGSPAISTGPVALNPAKLTNNNSLRNPALLPFGPTLSPTLVANNSTLANPTLVAGPATLSPTILVNVNGLNAPELVCGPVALAATLVATINSIKQPRLRPVIWGVRSVSISAESRLVSADLPDRSVGADNPTRSLVGKP